MEFVWKCYHICFQVLRFLRLIYIEIYFKTDFKPDYYVKKCGKYVVTFP